MMKQFVKQILYFVLALLIVIGVFALVSSNFKKKLLNPENFRLSDSTTVLIIGDSEVALSLNPEFIPYSDNQSIIAEPYLYTYTRLKLFLENNPQLESVLLGFNYQNIAKKYDLSLVDPREESFFFTREFMLLDENELKVFNSSDILFWRNYLAWKWGFPTKENGVLMLKSFFGKLDRKSLPYFGNYMDGGTAGSVGNAQGRIKETIGKESEYGIAPLQVEYLNKIIDLCRTHNVQLIMYASPLSKNYYDLIPDFLILEFERIQKELPDNIHFLNYARYSLSDSCFSDANHVNRYGAEIISRSVAEELPSLKK